MLFQALGVASVAFIVPIIILIVFKAITRFRHTNPTPWYIGATAVAALLIVVALSNPQTKLTAGLIAAAFLGISFVRDRKRFVGSRNAKQS